MEARERGLGEVTVEVENQPTDKEFTKNDTLTEKYTRILLLSLSLFLSLSLPGTT